MWKKGREGAEIGGARIKIKQVDLVKSNVVGRLRLGAEKSGLEPESFLSTRSGRRLLSIMGESARYSSY